MAKVRYFYIGSTPIDIEISPQLASTLDESLDNLNVKTIANDVENPYAPFQRFYVKDEYYNTIQTFIISADNVELATQNPNRYIHNLSLVQWSEFLTKHEIRNTVFSNSFDSAEIERTIGGRFYWKLDTQLIDKNFQSVSFDLSKIKIKSLTASPRFYALFQYYYTEYPDVDINEKTYCDYYANEKTISKWSDIYEDNPDNIEYPQIVFTIGGESKTWNLGDIEKDTLMLLPPEIIAWISGFASGTLTISCNALNSLYGWVTTPNSSVNLPVYGALLFDLSISSIEVSVYDAIDTLLKQQMKETDDYNSSNDSANIKPLFLLPTASHNPDLYNLLKETNTPNFVFTQSNMYDALAEIFKLFDAIFTIDNDGYLDIEYFNEQAQTPIDEPEVAGKSQSLSEERFTNRLITYFQNTKIDHKFPNSNDVNATAYIRSKVLGVPGQEDYCFEVPKPIYLIKRVKIKNLSKINSFKYLQSPIGGGDYIEETIYFNGATFLKTVDITPYIVEAKLWTLLPETGNANPYTNELYKENTLTYEQGSKVIDIGRYMNIKNGLDTSGTLVTNNILNAQISVLQNVFNCALLKTLGISSLSDLTWYGYNFTLNLLDVKLAVDYIALVDGKLVNESLDNKYNGETLINQSNGSIDINKLGLNMVGLGLKLGQPTLNMTQVFSKWDDRVRKGQYFVDDNGDRWVANNCVYTIIKPDLVQTNIEFVKNFNGLAQRIELNSEKRLSNISNELTVKCEETYGEYIYYSSMPFSAESKEKTAFEPDFITNQILMTIGDTLPTQSHGRFTPPPLMVVNSSLYDIRTKASYLKKGVLYHVTNAPVTDYNSTNGYLEVNDGNRVKIPEISVGADAVEYDLPTMNFCINKPSSYPTITTSDTVDLYFIVDEEKNVVGAVVDKINSDSTGFNISSVLQVVRRNTFTIEYAALDAGFLDGGVINNGDTGNVEHVAIPLMVYGSGNSVCFEMSYDDAMSAGNQLLDNSPLWSGGWFNNAVLYTDKEGKADYFTIHFIKLTEELTRYYPELKSSPNTLLSTYSFGKIGRLRYYKKPNEVFALNYQLHFMPQNKMRDFISNEFIKNNGFANGLNRRKFKIVTSTNENIYSILDTKGEGSSKEITSITSSHTSSNQKLELEITITTAIGDWYAVNSWALVDDNNNIYFATNNRPSAASLNAGEYKIFFITRHHRLT